MQTRSTCENNTKKCLEKSNDAYSLSRVQTTINHISICFYHNINVKENVFSSERELKKALRDTLMGAAWYGLLSTTILVPRGRAPFGQHQESPPLAYSKSESLRFSDFLSLSACSESSLTNLIGSRLNLLCLQSHSKPECRWARPGGRSQLCLHSHGIARPMILAIMTSLVESVREVSMAAKR